MTACFGNMLARHLSPCENSVTVGVLSCEGFLLWRLPYALDCQSGYCTVNASGL